MRQNNVISDRDYALAIEAPLTVTKTGSTSVEAPYFVDMVNDKLQNMFQDADFQSNAFRIYTTIDMRLQRAAVEAVRLGMVSVDEQIKKQRRFKGQTPPTPQVALVAIDPHTGEVKALVGGRNYGVSQLNHTSGQAAARVDLQALRLRHRARYRRLRRLAGVHRLHHRGGRADHLLFRQPGLQPSNFEKKFYGTVTLRDALAHSLNVATVKVGQMVGFDAVVEMANRAGMNYKIQPTPAVALGAYEITPVEAAGAYTIFANGGDYLKPSFLSMVRAQDGKVVFKNKVEEKQVLDPRVAYLTTSLMEEVLRSGTAAGVRARYNLTMPAGRQDRHLARWLVRRLHQRTFVRGLGGLRRQPRTQSGRRALGGAHMGRVHEARAGISGVPRCQTVPRAGRHRLHLDRSRIRHAGHAESVPRRAPKSTSPVPSRWASARCTAGAAASPRSPAGTPRRRPPHRRPAHTRPTITGSQGDGQVPTDPVARRAARQAAGQAASSAAPPRRPEGGTQERGEEGDSPALVACV